MARKKKRDADLKPEFLHSKAKSNKYLAALRKIQSHYGRVSVPLVVQEAKNEDNPLHDYFDWDIEEAAEKWWKTQARHLINHYRTFLLDRKGNPRRRVPQVPLFYSTKQVVVTENEEGEEEEHIEDVYEELDEILNNPNKEAQVIDEGLKAFRGVLNRYRSWKPQFKEMYDAWGKMIRRIRKK